MPQGVVALTASESLQTTVLPLDFFPSPLQSDSPSSGFLLYVSHTSANSTHIDLDFHEAAAAIPLLPDEPRDPIETL